jgi:hypothetical protein
MRMIMRAILIVVGLTAAAAAQGALQFSDVPPWHWAHDAVQSGGASGAFRGYPADDRELAVNAVTQVYEAFAHATHPRAREWAERFVTNLPANWAQPLERSRLASFALENVRFELSGDRGTVSFVAVTAQTGASASRTPMRVGVRKDSEGAWRVNYADLVTGQPQLFR